MSRFGDYDDFDGEPEQILAQGRWEQNARRVLTSKRGRQALRDLREALLALPEPRLIDSALCTVGGPARVPDVTQAEIDEAARRYEERGRPLDHEQWVRWERESREEQRAAIGAVAELGGEGVCVNGALLWHQKVKAGMDAAEAFAALPNIADGDGEGDALERTAHAGQEAGLAYTLAWELAYRNDETYGGKTPEERHAAFLEWIDKQLAQDAA